MNQKDKKELDFLVVDDDHLFCSRLVRALHERGFQTAGVETVAEALESLHEHHIARLILDLRIGGESGIKVLEEIDKQQIPTDVVILSGYGSIATATSAMKMGALDFLTKPVTVEQIIGAFDSEKPGVSEEVSVPSLSQVEWEHIQRVMNDCEGNVSKAAKALGMHRRSLQRKLQKSPGELQ